MLSFGDVNFMTKEGIIEVDVWVIMIIALLLFVPKNKMREASVVYLFKLFLTWALGLFVVQMKWIEYPKRFIFPYAHRSNFTFEYFVYPSICVPIGSLYKMDLVLDLDKPLPNFLFIPHQ
jgi:hypothetical protein